MRPLAEIEADYERICKELKQARSAAFLDKYNDLCGKWIKYTNAPYDCTDYEINREKRYYPDLYMLVRSIDHVVEVRSDVDAINILYSKRIEMLREATQGYLFVEAGPDENMDDRVYSNRFEVVDRAEVARAITAAADAVLTESGKIIGKIL